MKGWKVTKRLRGDLIQEFEEKERYKQIVREDVGGNIVIVGQVMRAGVDATREGKRQTKEGNLRGGKICGGGTDKTTGTVFRVGMDGIVEQRGYSHQPPPP